MAETDWISAAEAARRLGIKQATLYSYVSRGVLTRRRASGTGGASGGSGGGRGSRGGGPGHGSLFDPGEVEELARRGRPRRAPGLAGLVIESGVTEITDDGLWFRGMDALDLARDWDFEDVCDLLWLGQPQPLAPADAGEWQAARAAVAAGTAAQAALPPGTYPLERLQVIVPALAAADPLRLQFDPPAVAAAGRAIIAGLVDCLPPARPVSQQTPAGAANWQAPSGIPARLWTRLCPDDPPPSLLDALRAALVLLADHELAASTLAARVAASVRADPYAVVATGLGAVGGALHGGASLGAETML